MAMKKNGTHAHPASPDPRSPTAGPAAETEPAPTPATDHPRRGNDRHGAQWVRRDSQERLEAILNALPDLMFRVDGESRILDFHPQESTAFYVPPSHFLGQKMTEVLPPPAVAIIQAALAEAAVQGHHQGATYSLPVPPGSLSWFELSIAAMRPPGAPDQHFILLARNITARKEAEAQIRLLNETLEQRVAERTAELRASEQRYRDLNAHLEREVAARTAEIQVANALLREREEHLQLVLEGSRLGTWDWNLATGEVIRNDYWAEMLGFTPQELDDATAKVWSELVHPEDRERAWQAIEAHLDGRTSLYEEEYRLRTRAGGYRWIVDRGRIVSRDEAGRPQRIAGTLKDISHRKLAQQALEESHQRLLTILNGMEAMVYLADMTSYEVLFLNQSAAQSFGQVLGQPCYRVLQGLEAPCPFCTNDRLVNADGSPAGVYAWEFQNQLNHRWYDLRDCAVR